MHWHDTWVSALKLLQLQPKIAGASLGSTIPFNSTAEGLCASCTPVSCAATAVACIKCGRAAVRGAIASIKLENMHGRTVRQDAGRVSASCSGATVGDAGAGHAGRDVGRQPTAGQSQRSSYASVTGQASSYARVHGEVSRESADWTDIPSVARETLDDVRYQKAEGIAKARSFHASVCTMLNNECEHLARETSNMR